MNKRFEGIRNIAVVKGCDQCSRHRRSFFGKVLVLIFVQNIIVSDHSDAVASLNVVGIIDYCLPAPMHLLSECLRRLAEFNFVFIVPKDPGCMPYLPDGYLLQQVLEAMYVIIIWM